MFHQAHPKRCAQVVPKSLITGPSAIGEPELRLDQPKTEVGFSPIGRPPATVHVPGKQHMNHLLSRTLVNMFGISGPLRNRHPAEQLCSALCLALSKAKIKVEADLSRKADPAAFATFCNVKSQTGTQGLGRRRGSIRKVPAANEGGHAGPLLLRVWATAGHNW